MGGGGDKRWRTLSFRFSICPVRLLAHVYLCELRSALSVHIDQRLVAYESKSFGLIHRVNVIDVRFVLVVARIKPRRRASPDRPARIRAEPNL